MIAVRRALDENVPRLAQLHGDATRTAYAGLFPPNAVLPSLVELTREWQAWLDDPSALVLVAAGPSALAGQAVLVDEVDTLRLSNLHVDPSAQGRGVGTRLLDFALGEATRGPGHLSLWVLDGNDRARSWYERRGWTLTGRTKPQRHSPTVREVEYERDVTHPVPRPTTEPALRRLPLDTPFRNEILAAHTAAVKAGQQGYLDPRTGLFAMTATGLLERGHCCGTGCRHCPWTT